MRVAVVVFAVLLAAVQAGAQGQPPRAPEYDVQAEVTVRGEVVEVHESKLATDHPGLHVVIRNEEETVEVHACPVRFLKELEFTIEPGDKLAVTGSRRKGTNLIVAREIVKGQLSLILRDKTGAPNWLPR
jgi:DNA/RNA endonuclease YhcR with UshA esterase domain